MSAWFHTLKEEGIPMRQCAATRVAGHVLGDEQDVASTSVRQLGTRLFEYNRPPSIPIPQFVYTSIARFIY